MLKNKYCENILFIAPYADLAKKTREVTRNLEINLKITHTKSISDSIEYIREMINERNIDAIITRGGTALKIREKYDIPVVEVEVTILDIIKSIEKAKHYGKCIAVIGFKNIICNIKTLSSFLDVDIHEISIKNYLDCTNAVKKASELGVDIIVGDRIAVKTANRFGLRGELIESDSDECITKAIYKGVEIADLRRRQLTHAEEIKIITELTYSGIIATDSEGRITLFNAESSDILNIESNNAIGINYNEIIPEFNLSQVLKDGKKEFDEILHIFDKYLILHKIPIIIDSAIQGVVVTFQELDQIQELEKKARNKLAQKGHVARFTFDSIIGSSKPIKSVIEKAKNYSVVDSSILITGDTGTGKEVFAQSIHNHSQRRNGPFVSVNCAALPYTLLESELFGYVKGSFTGAKEEGKIGLFEQAHGGTIFLDEIAEIPMEIQARLLRVLQGGHIQKIGDDKIITVDTRIISATNKDLKELIKENKFREDLFYRINVLNIKLPNLESRIEDIPLFVKSFVKSKAKKHKKIIYKIDKKIITKLCSLSYPGNIRQLENIVERLVVECMDGEIKNEDLSLVLDDDVIVNTEMLDLNRMTQHTIKNALKVTDNNKSDAALLLGIDRSTLWRKMKSFEIE